MVAVSLKCAQDFFSANVYLNSKCFMYLDVHISHKIWEHSTFHFRGLCCRLLSCTLISLFRYVLGGKSVRSCMLCYPLSECGNPPIMFKALTHRHILWHIHYRGASFNCIIQHFLIPKVAQCQSLPPLSSVSAIVLGCRILF